jgi:SRSO17 transposase
MTQAAILRSLSLIVLNTASRTARTSQYAVLIEWPDGETAPTKYWLSNVAETISFRRLVDIAKLRWRIERDYQDLKQERGLATTKDAAGAASTITARCASRPTDS